ncbi:MAG: crossover junction endodeoxyribonuclease RuvC [Desulfobacteraceae bacterium]|nr:crossover junction endodeoxyribonuclease RuvC [Desulfobacteraceae bacterium]
MIKVIGIDPGLAATGIGIVSGQNNLISSYAFGAVKTDPHASQPTRLDKIYTRLHHLLGEEKPDLLIIEDVFSLDKFPQSGIVLGKVCGVILLAGHQTNTPVREIAVREAKQVLTGNGNATKTQLEKAVRKSLGCNTPIRPFHASDALGLALIGLFRYATYKQGMGRLRLSHRG